MCDERSKEMRGIGVDERLWLRGVFSCTGPCGLNDVQAGVVWGPGSSEGEWGVGFGGSNSKKPPLTSRVYVCKTDF